MALDLDADADLHAPTHAALDALADLGSYPHWLGIVGRADAVAAHPDDPEGAPAWSVDLVGKLGPLKRAKTVRMVRTERDEAAGAVRFERCEHDGRVHNAWVLTGRAAPRPDDPSRTRVHVHLHYSGGRTLPGADLLLRQEARRAGERLQAWLDRPEAAS